MSERIKDYLWFIQFSLWRGLAVFLMMKLTLFVALDIAIYGIIFLAGSRTSIVLPITYWMNHHGLAAYQILMIRPGSPIGNAANNLAFCTCCVYVAWRILRYSPKNLPTSNAPLSK